MHHQRARTIFAASLTSVLILCSSGCEDSASRQRDEVRSQLTRLRGDLQQTIARGGDDYSSQLNRIVSELSSVSGGEPGQQSAKALLAANALRELALVNINRAAAIESEHRASLGTVHARADAAMRLQSLASGLESIDAQRRRTELQAALQSTMNGVTEAQSRISDLDTPINERTTQNQQQKAEIERLRLQVSDLMRQARAAGYLGGLETYQHATQINRRADRIEFEVSNREIDLEHDLSPQQDMARTEKGQLEAMARTIESALAELDAFSRAATGDAQASRTQAQQFTGEINTTLAAIRSKADSELKAAYDEALQALERAATNARSAGSGGGAEAGAAKMLSASISETTARVHLSAANGLADRLAALNKIKSAGGAIRVDGIDSQISDLTSTRNQHLDAARTAIDEASQTAESIPGSGSEIAAYRAILQSLASGVSGNPGTSMPNVSQDADSSMNDGTHDDVAVDPTVEGPADTQTTSARVIPPNAGADSPEALVAKLQDVTTIAQLPSMFDAALPPVDQDVAGMMAGFRRMIEAVANLETHMQTKFSKSLLDIEDGQMGDMSIIAGAELVHADNQTGTIKITDSNGETVNAPICQFNGRWFIGSLDDDMAAMASLMGDDSGMTEMPEKPILAMMTSMFTSMSQAIRDITGKVERGELATFDDATTELESAMQAAAGAAMGMPMGDDDPNK